MSEVRLLREDGHRPVVTLAFAAAYLLAGVVGRQAVLDGTTFALVWPAAGVAVLWLLVQRSSLPDVAVLALVSFAANFATGAAVDIAVVLLLTNTAQAVVAVALLRRWCPTLWGAGGDRSLDTTRATAWYLGALSAGMAVGALIGFAGTHLTGGDVDALGLLLWFDRNLCGALAITTLGLLIGQRLESPEPRPALVESDTELVLAALFSVLMYAVAFAFQGQPLAFTLLAATVWFGVRFSTVVSGWHSLLSGAAAVVLTLSGQGPFADQNSPEVAALLVQFFVGMILVSGVVLSTGREERRLLADDLRRARYDAEYHAGVMEAVISSVVEGLVVVDDTGRILVSNPAAAQLLGYPEGVPSHATSMIAHRLDGSRVPEEERPTRRVLAGEVLRNVDIRYISRQGDERVMSVSGAPLPRDEVHGRSRAVLLFRDATEDHAQRAELAAFAGVVAHDLRNPLAAIEGWIELLETEAVDGVVPEDVVAHYASRVRASAGRMQGLILHLLAHATSKDADLSLARIDLGETARRIAAARESSELVVVEDMPLARGDRVLVDQVFDNLVGNALKYVADGTRPSVHVSAAEDEDGWVRVRIADNGIGLPEGEHERVFEEFHRAHGGRAYEGTGLGLSICRRIIARHGGTIRALDNPAGQGTVFEFTLPSLD